MQIQMSKEIDDSGELRLPKKPKGIPVFELLT